VSGMGGCLVPEMCGIDNIVAIIGHQLGHGELVFDTGVLDASILCDCITSFSLEGAKWRFERRGHGCGLGKE
jgi:hypothetical protein